MCLAVHDEESHHGIQLRLLECVHNLRVATQSQGFPKPMISDYENSPARKAIRERWGDTITIRKLIEIAEVISKKVNVNPPTRTEKRKKELMFKWFNFNWESIKDVLADLQMEVEASD
jgi:hypothetical protein